MILPTIVTTTSTVTKRNELLEMIRAINQFIGLYVRELMNTFRNPAVVILSIVQPMLWIVFFGSSFAYAPVSFLTDFFQTDNYVAFLLSGQLATSMLFVGMFSSLSLIQDKKSGYVRRIMITPTRNYIIFLSKVFGATTRGMLQVPIVFIGVMILGVQIPDAIGLMMFLFSLLLLSLGLSSIYLLLTMSSSDWQIPTLISNFINLPLMFASTALFPNVNFPLWMQTISNLNPVSFSSTFGREIIFAGNISEVSWIYFYYLLIFAGIMLIVGIVVANKTLKID
ncbi:ABC transporter permease [Candidatus Nitrosocosmicus hydrocola]|uniref:ABC transporter permease n=1 Tax=Candidatus Nitrosocosmicus hydrocola TaxID=1826872 RepID=UPI0013726077|nr:ABC transporter permease [Candidatus Nitrosocosmicus hydrocola]